jgi:hypothetical protein
MWIIGACGTDADPVAGVATYEPDGEGSDGALLEGTLRDVGECLYIETADGTRFLPVFPNGSVTTPQRTLAYDGRDYSSGDAMALGGGEVDPNSALARDVSVPERCRGGPQPWLVNQGE